MPIDQPHRRSDTEPIADAKVRSVSSLRIFCNQKLVSDSRIQTNTQRGKGAIGARFTKVCAKSSTCNISRGSREVLRCRGLLGELARGNSVSLLWVPGSHRK